MKSDIGLYALIMGILGVPYFERDAKGNKQRFYPSAVQAFRYCAGEIKTAEKGSPLYLIEGGDTLASHLESESAEEVSSSQTTLL